MLSRYLKDVQHVCCLPSGLLAGSKLSSESTNLASALMSWPKVLPVAVVSLHRIMTRVLGDCSACKWVAYKFASQFSSTAQKHQLAGVHVWVQLVGEGAIAAANLAAYTIAWCYMTTVSTAAELSAHIWQHPQHVLPAS